MENIALNVKRLLVDVPHGVIIVAAAKTRTPDEMRQVLESGITSIGHNFIQEAEASINNVGDGIRWHFIGHLQRNKVKKAALLFDIIETIDSVALATALDKQHYPLGKFMPVLVEVNSGTEPQKHGVLPKDTLSLIREISLFSNLRVMGLMTMGPHLDNPDDLTPYFKKTKKLFDDISVLGIEKVDMKYLSMGMTDSYHQAISAGANVVRIGSAIFGPRH